MPSWIPPLVQANLDRLVAIDGELVRMPPRSVPGTRRRLLIQRTCDGAERIPVRVTSLSPIGCDVAGPQSAAADVPAKPPLQPRVVR